MSIELILAFLGLVLSAFCSASEIAMITANPLQLQKWHTEKKALSASAVKIYENRQHYLTLILIGNTLANVMATTFATIILSFYDIPWWQSVLLIAGVILLFGEVLPKSLVRLGRPSSFLLLASILINFLHYLLYPFVIVFESMTRVLMRVFKSKQTPMNITIRREEIEKSIFDSYRSGVLNAEKQKYIDNLFDFSDTSAGEIITPRTDIIALRENTDLQQVKNTFIESGFSKIIIYRESIDFIIGYISLRDIFATKKDLRDMIRPIKFYPETKSIIELLKEFQRTQTSIAVIVDEFGGTAGIVTMEDIVEEIFGEFSDEYDVGDQDVLQQPGGELIMSGRAEIDYLNDEFTLKLPEGDYETVAGFILASIDRFPRVNERIHVQGHEFTVLKATAKSIELLKYRKLPAAI